MREGSINEIGLTDMVRAASQGQVESQSTATPDSLILSLPEGVYDEQHHFDVIVD
jgi:hypothetical protein